MKKKNNRKKCYIYTRVSTAAQTEGFSLEAQQERLYEYAEYRELEIAGDYCDAGKSGKSIKGRPEFQRMMDDIISQKDNISYVLVFKLSRFGRNAADVLKSMQLLTDYGVDLVSVDDAIDSSTQGGRLTLTILSAVAEIERENITDQFMAGRLQKIRDGKWSGGSVPYGYRSVDRELTIDPYEASIVRKIFDLYMEEDMGATSVAVTLNDEDYLRKENGGVDQRPFTYDFIVNVLDNPIYCGKLIFGRRTNKKGPDGKLLKPDPKHAVIAQGVHETILTEEEWNAVQEKRERLSKNRYELDNPERISLLSGLVRCPMCGSGMIHTKNKRINRNHGGYYKTIHYYACNNSRKSNGMTCSFRHTYNQEKIDSSVFEIIQRLTTLPEYKNAVTANLQNQATVEQLEERLKQERKELRKEELNNRKLGEQLDALDIMADGYEVTYDQILAEIDEGYDKIEEIERKIRSIMRKLESLKQGFKASENIERMLNHFTKLYDHMSCQERREMYRLFIDHIEVLPETRKDGKMLKSISFRFSTEYGEDILTPEGDKDDDICFTLDCTKQALTKAEAKATYAELKKYILETNGVKVSSLYIAQIKRKYGIDMGANYNMAADPEKHVPKCPAAKEQIIIDALKHYRMLDPSVEMIPNSEVVTNES
ncbi:MAG: recombinase family protein [Blautia massiliensis]|uniref:recombinase family protein n=1 Tax=Blautia massiliensis (ex Durand et al. 2017) TaxID=1737424 RepID=UPI00243189FF|nr:recombinase family protein [Blautia massiliensis (ex Durand et al. 2017)]MCI7604338.1 recombinase family protein [Blautia massiliensis (ex Durand et al. 2017)]